MIREIIAIFGFSDNIRTFPQVESARKHVYIVDNDEY